MEDGRWKMVVGWLPRSAFTFYLLPLTSYLLHLTSYILHLTSYVLHLTSPFFVYLLASMYQHLNEFFAIRMY